MNKKLIRLTSGLMTAAVMLSSMSVSAGAISCRKDSFDKSRYKLTGNMAYDAAQIAKSQEGMTCDDLGYSGGDYGQWCDEFAADCLENAGADSSIVAHGGSVADFERVMRSKGAVPVSTPQVGDLVFFGEAHVEIITRVEDGVYYCAGGNNGYYPGNCAGERPIDYMGMAVSVYLRPNYKNSSTPGQQPTVEPQPVYDPYSSENPNSYSVPLRDLYYNQNSLMKGPDVAWLQAVLKKGGYKVDIDGTFGPGTKSAVQQFQRDYGLTADGIVGTGTKAKLIEFWTEKQKKSSYSETFYTDKSLSKVYKKYNVKYGDPLVEPQKPTKSGYSFEGWYDKSTNKLVEVSNEKMNSKLGRSFYAVWKKISTLGDVNKDGSINSSDGLLALEHSVGRTVLSGENFTAADVNMDNKVNSSDTLLILQYSVGKIKQFK